MLEFILDFLFGGGLEISLAIVPAIGAIGGGGIGAASGLLPGLAPTAAAAGGGGGAGLGTQGQIGGALGILSSFLPQVGGQTQISGLNLTPEQQAQLNQALAGLFSQSQQFQQAIGLLPGQVQTQLPLQTTFAGPQFAESLDPRAQRIVSQGTQALQQQAGARQAQVSTRFQGQPGVANVLGQQAALQASLQSNPLLFQAAIEQRSREAQEFNLQQMAQQLSNQALLGQASFQNQALSQQANLLGLPVAAQGNLLSQLAAALSTTGQRTTTQERRSGGIIDRIGALF